MYGIPHNYLLLRFIAVQTLENNATFPFGA